MKRLLFAAIAATVVAYCALGAYHFFDIEDAEHDARFYPTGPGWQR